MTTFGAFEATWFWGVDEDGKIILYKYPPPRVGYQEMLVSFLYTLFFKPLSVSPNKH